MNRAVALPRKTVSEADEAALSAAVEPGEIDDVVRPDPGDRRRPFRVACLEMRFEARRIVGEARKVVAVGKPFLEQDMHDRTSERRVGAGQWREVLVGDLGRGGAVGVDNDELGAPFFPRGCDMGHDIDLGRNRVATPTHDQIGFCDLAPVDAALGSNPGEPAGVRQRAANRRMLPRIAHRVAQAVDAVALHTAHRPAVVMRPYRFGAVALCGDRQLFGDFVERVFPGDRHKGRCTNALFANPAHWS